MILKRQRSQRSKVNSLTNRVCVVYYMTTQMDIANNSKYSKTMYYRSHNIVNNSMFDTRFTVKTIVVIEINSESVVSNVIPMF